MGEMPPINGLDGGLDTGFTVKDAPVENLRPLKVIVIGAGYSGILAAIRIPERLRNVELVVYEKNEAVGGVWYALLLSLVDRIVLTWTRWLNRYPGMSNAGCPNSMAGLTCSSRGCL
jgi:cation diffusion facilitator CzcD-associated flavoprotein CzcO